MTATSLTLTLLLASTVLAAAAQADEALAKARNCLACHSADKKIVGPSYKDVAKKYARQKDAEGQLAAAIIKGSKGTWGAVPMPPNATVKPGEANQLAQWILSTK